MTVRPSRRDVLKAGAGATAGLAAGPVLPPALIQALAQAPTCGTLPDIEHVVIFIQENRSFDHYFGRYPGVRGFDDRTVKLSNADDGTAVFKQANPGHSPNPVLPFRLDTTSSPAGMCTHDIGHQWVEQHDCWNNQQMDAFVKTHVTAEGAAAGPLTMGYYERGDLPFYWSLADNFTICDNYFTSTLSGTVANRIYGLSGTLDQDGLHGGPVINTPEAANQQDYKNLIAALTLNTYPEVLEANGVSWKVYNPDAADLAAPLLNDNYLVFFKNYFNNPSLFQKAFGSVDYPVDFIADCQNGTLPTVSWLLTPFIETEHPPTPLTWGEFAVGQAIQALAGNPDLWSKTVMLLTWDDSGGFFDHVPPPVPSNPNEPGEHLKTGVTPPAGTDGGILTPIGLGFRVPMLVISPFSRNPRPRSDPNWHPMVCNQLFDHTSVLRFLKSLLVAKGHSPADVDLPYDTDWRRNHAGGTGVGDLTGAFNFGGGNLPAPSLTYRSVADFAAVLNPLTHPECILAPNTELPDPQPAAFPIPTVTDLPIQDPGSPKRPTGIVAGQAACFPPVVIGSAQPVGPGNSLPNTGGAGPASLPGEVLAGAAILAGAWWTRRKLQNATSRETPGEPEETEA